MSDSQKLVLIGLDGATFRVLQPLIDAGVMPTVAKMVREGASGPLMSTHPPVTCPAWPTMYTGVNPGKHGVFSFTCRGSGRPHTASLVDVKSPTMWELLSADGRRCAVLNVPITYPAQELNGVMLSGFPAPDAAPEVVWPRERHADLIRALPQYRVNWPGIPHAHQADEQAAEVVRSANDWLGERIESFDHVLDRDDFDFCFLVFEYPDKVQHAFYPFLDPACPESQTHNPNLLDALHRGFREIDAAIAGLLRRFGADANYMIVSDHGFGPIRRVVYLNHLLEQHGLFAPRRGRAMAAKAAGVMKVPLAVRARLGLGQDEPWHRLDTWQSPLTNFAKTKAFGGHQYEHAVYINTKRKTAHGIVADDEYDGVRKRIVDVLQSATDPKTGERIFAAVSTAEEVYHGDKLADAPDVVFDLSPGYLVSSGIGLSVGLEGGFLRDARSGDVRGYHLSDGVFIGYGPAFRAVDNVTASLLDVAPTALALMGVSAIETMDGRVIEEAIKPDAVSALDRVAAQPAAQRESSTDEVYSAEEEMEITRRLADLGYL